MNYPKRVPDSPESLRRERVAIAAMQAIIPASGGVSKTMIGNQGTVFPYPDFVADAALQYADALLAKLDEAQPGQLPLDPAMSEHTMD